MPTPPNTGKAATGVISQVHRVRLVRAGQNPRVSWSAVVPVRSWGEGKTRLGTRTLIRAFTEDVVDALRHAPDINDVIVTSGDPQVGAWAQQQGVSFHVDDVHELNAALLSASPQGNVAYFLADVPCLRAVDVMQLLAHSDRPSFVSDTAGTGSTCAFFPAGTVRTPAFGPRSRAAHRALGLHELTEADLGQETASRVRRDVDTPVDLWDARRIGVGVHTHTMCAETGVRQ